MKNCVGCTLDRVKFDGSKSPKKEKLLYVDNCKDCNFKELEFYGKKTEGVCFNLTGAKSEGNNVIDAYWHDIESTAKNGAEPMRIGNSSLSHCWLRTSVVRPRFKNIKTREPELISIKSNGNEIDGGADQDLKIINVDNCTSNITVRHGHTNTIRNIRTKGEGGIRVYGKNNTLENIEMNENKSDNDDFPTIQLRNGDVLEDPNEKAGIEPGKENSKGHATYTQCKNNKLINIKLINCKHGLLFGVKSGKYKPVGTRVHGLHVVNTDGKASTAAEFSKGASANGNFFDDCFYEGKVTIPESIKPSFTKGKPDSPEPIVVPDIEEGEGPTKPDEEDEEVPPVGPEPIPIEEPAEEAPKHGHVCQICGKEDARGRYSVYVCVDDMSEEIKAEFNKAWAVVEAKIQSGEIKLQRQIEQEEEDAQEG